ncbi:MAG: TrkA family potassium uptake protein, partial [Bacteroidota bacterium]
VQGEFFRQIHFNVIQKSISQLNDHIILCGYGKYGKEIADNFLKHSVEFVVIDIDEGEIEKIQKSKEAILYIEGDATEEEILEKAGIKKAKALICALDEDSSNVFAVITARQLNNKINIISRARQERAGKKLRLAGANHIIRPEQIGGFYMASLVNKPGAVEFFTYITNEAQSDILFEELSYDTLPEACHGLCIRELKIREATGANIIGYKQPDGKYIVNPAPSCTLLPNSSFIVLGSKQQLDQLHTYLDNYQE